MRNTPAVRSFVLADLALLVIATGFAGCVSTASDASSGAGGSGTAGNADPSGSGGIAVSGGTPGNGGNIGTGGSVGSGGSVANGGTPGTGGTTTTSSGTGTVTVACPGAVPSGVTAAWCSCDQWGQWANGSATYYNDIWGSGAGSQCIWATTSGEWGIAANHPSTTGIKSYPNVSYSPAKTISTMIGYSSTFAVTVPSSGSWETTYDIWVKSGSTRIEIMLWMNKNGAVNPMASKYNSSGNAVADVSNVTVGGHAWNVYYGSNGSTSVVTLVSTANTNSGTVDIKAILDWIITNKGSFTTSWSLDQVQFGFEITSDGAAQSFVTNSLSVSSS